jgi:FkbM family methyltransferase
VKQAAKIALSNFADRLGFTVRKKTSIGNEPYIDIGRLAGTTPVVFDVGANIGQSVEHIKQQCPNSTIHAFEPGREAFAKLAAAHGKTPDVKLNNFALGSKAGQLELIENSYSVLCSFLEPGRDSLGEVTTRHPVAISTVDEYAGKHSVNSIDVLKLDTQGFDLEVLKGATRMLLARRIKLIHIELTFVQMYLGAPRVDELMGFIYDEGFETAALYNVFYRNDRAGEVDGLFIQPEYRK